MLNESRKKRYKQKLERLGEYNQLFKNWFSGWKLSDLEQQRDFEKIFAIYHSIQLIIEVITDIIAMILKDLSLVVEDNYTNFEKLFKKKMISNDLFQGLKKLNGLRNRIVHDYNGIIDEVVWVSMEENNKYIDEFESIVKKWLEQNT
ncbi:MAG: DUF86 domain-containing protein [Candidatus Lokiarchaeota archaeon]|nr:DUF86 domain-containing protein [Candidatus Lokiarchaeota archaeon]